MCLKLWAWAVALMPNRLVPTTAATIKLFNVVCILCSCAVFEPDTLRTDSGPRLAPRHAVSARPTCRFGTAACRWSLRRRRCITKLGVAQRTPGWLDTFVYPEGVGSTECT